MEKLFRVIKNFIFSNNKGTDLLSVTYQGQPVTGQHNVFASATKDNNTNDLIIKIINTDASAQSLSLNLKDVSLKGEGKITTLRSLKLDDLKFF